MTLKETDNWRVVVTFGNQSSVLRGVEYRGFLMSVGRSSLMSVKRSPSVIAMTFYVEGTASSESIPGGRADTQVRVKGAGYDYEGSLLSLGLDWGGPGELWKLKVEISVVTEDKT